MSIFDFTPLFLFTDRPSREERAMFKRIHDSVRVRIDPEVEAELTSDDVMVIREYFDEVGSDGEVYHLSKDDEDSSSSPSAPVDA